MVVYRKPNLLLLDEPTNHLDLDMRHALETALLDYAGAVVLVSHDRHLLSTTCEELWLVAQGGGRVFDGDLDDYARWLNTARQLRQEARAAAQSRPAGRALPRDQRRAAADQRAALRPLKAAVRKLDARMARLREQIAAAEARLAGTEIYEPQRGAELAALVREQAAMNKELAAAEEEWLTASGQLEALDG